LNGRIIAASYAKMDHFSISKGRGSHANVASPASLGNDGKFLV
jgi:hypothetical protein